MSYCNIGAEWEDNNRPGPIVSVDINIQSFRQNTSELHIVLKSEL
jgi:hypothetical protein